MSRSDVKIECLPIGDVKLVHPPVFRDSRGYFCEAWNAKSLKAAGINAVFVQDNQAYSHAEGTVRALHFQTPPKAQDKLVRVVRGAILDVAVDLRKTSPTFGKHVSAVLSGENRLQMWVPKGFAHGYVTLEPHTEVIYKVTDYYSPQHDAGLQWDDPALGIDWGVTREAAVLSEKDIKLPPLSALRSPF
jgi:dTDP-4-dehydrorhamnose 3,5-epimerase